MRNDSRIPEISVVLPCFNREKTIGRAIESVIAQNFTNWELIVVDDCSTDDSFKIIQKYSRNNYRIKGYKLKPNGGAAAARNFGIKKSQSSYISLLDSDDWYEPSFLGYSFHKIKNTKKDVGFIWTGVTLVEDTGRTSNYWTNNYPFESYINFLHSLHIGTSAGITFKKEIFNEVGFFREDLPAVEDTDFFLRVSKKFNYDYIKEALINVDKRGADRMSINYNNIAIAYNKFLPDHFEVINKFPVLQKKYYYKMMWLNYYLKNKIEARKYFKILLKKFNFNPKILLVFLAFEFFPYEFAKSLHQRGSSN